MRAAPIFVLLLAAAPGQAQDRTEIVNRSGQPWTLALVEGTRPGRGSLSLLDKFNGRTEGTLTKVGQSATIPPQGRLLVVFNREGGYLFRHFILRDHNGYYGEYSAKVEFLSAPKIAIELVDQHVGPPMDRAEEAAVRQFLGDAIEIGSESIIIHPNALSSPESDAPLSVSSPEGGPAILRNDMKIRPIDNLKSLDHPEDVD